MCPSSRIEYVSAPGETRTITTVDPASISAQDNDGGTIVPSVFPPTFTVNADQLGHQEVTVTASDQAGNSDVCTFDIDVQGEMTYVMENHTLCQWHKDNCKNLEWRICLKVLFMLCNCPLL